MQNLWQNCKNECLKPKRELFRLIPLVSNVNGIPQILKELKQIKIDHEESYIHQVLSSVTSAPEFDHYINSLIDLNLEKKLVFVMTKVKSANAPRYLQWIINDYMVIKLTEFVV